MNMADTATPIVHLPTIEGAAMAIFHFGGETDDLD
jgi:hypothetical protein